MLDMNWDFKIPSFEHAIHIGDVEIGKRVLKLTHNDTILYGVEVEGEVVSFLQGKEETFNGEHFTKVLVRYTTPEFRNQQIGTKLMFFIRNHEKQKLMLGDHQSSDAREALKAIANTGRFEISWYNIKTGERHKYEQDKDSVGLKPFRSVAKPTDWRVVFETFEEPWTIPRFLDKSDPLTGFSFFE